MMPDSPPDFDPGFIRQLDTLLRWRRDVRGFLRRPVAEADMAYLLETAGLAPSVGNSQPWRFVRVRSAGMRERLAEHVDACVADAAPDPADPRRRDLYRSLKLHGIREAPELLVVFCDDDPEAGHGLGRATMRETPRYSTVMAIHTLWLAARARGIGLGWVSILDPAAVSTMLDVPDGWAMIAMLCVGYPAQPSAVPELERRGWQKREPMANRIIER